MRPTARITGVKPDIVQAVGERVDAHAERLLNHDLRRLWPREIQLDELRTFLRKKEAHLTDEEVLRREFGDCWVWVAFDPRSKVVLGFVLGKRTKDRAVRLPKRVHEVLTPGSFPLFTSDELAAYEDAINQVFDVNEQPARDGTRGHLPKMRRVPHARLPYAVVHKHRQNNRVLAVERRIVLGRPDQIDRTLAASEVSHTINTTGIERTTGNFEPATGASGAAPTGLRKPRECSAAPSASPSPATTPAVPTRVCAAASEGGPRAERACGSGRRERP